METASIVEGMKTFKNFSLLTRFGLSESIVQHIRTVSFMYFLVKNNVVL